MPDMVGVAHPTGAIEPEKTDNIHNHTVNLFSSPLPQAGEGIEQRGSLVIIN